MAATNRKQNKAKQNREKTQNKAIGFRLNARTTGGVRSGVLRLEFNVIAFKNFPQPCWGDAPMSLATIVLTKVRAIR